MSNTNQTINPPQSSLKRIRYEGTLHSFSTKQKLNTEENNKKEERKNPGICVKNIPINENNEFDIHSITFTSAVLQDENHHHHKGLVNLLEKSHINKWLNFSKPYFYCNYCILMGNKGNFVNTSIQ